MHIDAPHIADPLAWGRACAQTPNLVTLVDRIIEGAHLLLYKHTGRVSCELSAEGMTMSVLWLPRVTGTRPGDGARMVTMPTVDEQVAVTAEVQAVLNSAYNGLPLRIDVVQPERDRT